MSSDLAREDRSAAENCQMEAEPDCKLLLCDPEIVKKKKINVHRHPLGTMYRSTATRAGESVSATAKWSGLHRIGRT